MAYPYLDHANHVGLTHARVGDELRLTVTQQTGKMPTGGTTGQIIKKQSATDYDAAWANEAAAVLEAVEGGAGFAPVSGPIALDLAPARAFHHEMVGNITGLSFTNVPDANVSAASWTWVLRINTTGGYTFSGWPTVTFVDGRSFEDTDLRANAVNQFTFWTVGAEVYGALVSNGRLELGAREMCFIANDTILVPMLRAEVLDPANAVKTGNGVITYAKNGTPITGNPLPETAFAAGDVLSVTCASLTTTTGIAIPRYAP